MSRNPLYSIEDMDLALRVASMVKDAKINPDKLRELPPLINRIADQGGDRESKRAPSPSPLGRSPQKPRTAKRARRLLALPPSISTSEEEFLSWANPNRRLSAPSSSSSEGFPEFASKEETCVKHQDVITIESDDESPDSKVCREKDGSRLSYREAAAFRKTDAVTLLADREISNTSTKLTLTTTRSGHGLVAKFSKRLSPSPVAAPATLAKTGASPVAPALRVVASVKPATCTKFAIDTASTPAAKPMTLHPNGLRRSYSGPLPVSRPVSGPFIGPIAKLPVAGPLDGRRFAGHPFAGPYVGHPDAGPYAGLAGPFAGHLAGVSFAGHPVADPFVCYYPGSRHEVRKPCSSSNNPIVIPDDLPTISVRLGMLHVGATPADEQKLKSSREAASSENSRGSLESSDEFPNGNIKFKRNVQDYDTILLARSVGWATQVYRRNIKSDGSMIKIHKKCLGILRCPAPDCRWVRRPKVNGPVDYVTGETRIDMSDTPESQFCAIHERELEHLPCTAVLDLVEEGGCIKFTHRGYHTHQAPIPKRASQDALNYLETIVSTAPESRPKHLLHKTELRDPISRKYMVYRNLSYVRHLRNKIIHKNRSANDLGSLAALEEVVGSCFVVSSSISSFDGHISIVIDFIREHAQTLDSSLSTDSIHDIVTDDHYADICVTVTSAFSDFVDRTVPITMTIHLGKTSEHYKKHFLAVFDVLNYRDWDDFDENFPGMTCDFADAERIGFKDAVLERFDIAPEDFVLERYFGYCIVHYERSVVRIRKNGAIIPPGKEMDFYVDAMMLASSSVTRFEFDNMVAGLLERFPKIRRWLDFYLHQDRSKIIFPALRDVAAKETISKDTNAQESLGGDFKLFVKRTHPTCSIIQGVSAIVRYQESFMEDFEFVCQGGVLRYKDSRKENPTQRSRSSREGAKNRRKTAGMKLRAQHDSFVPRKPLVNVKYTNDGRAPDTTKALLDEETNTKAKGAKRKRVIGPRDTGRDTEGRGAGRPRGSRNVLPSIRSVGDIDWDTFGIPWRRQEPVANRFTFENSCPVDTTLMAWFLLSKHSGATLPSAVARSNAGQTLLRVMEEIRATRYDYARELWCTEAMELAGDQHHDLFKSLEEVFLDILPGLTRFETDYKRAAIMYSNGTHFCCTVFAGTVAFVYDGARRGRLIRNVPIKSVTHPPGYRIIHVWYIIERPDPEEDLSLIAKDVVSMGSSNGSPTADAESHSTSTVDRSDTNPCKESAKPQKGSPSVSANGKAKSTASSETKVIGTRRSQRGEVTLPPFQDTLKTRRSKKTYYPAGLSVCSVSKKGKRPVCGACKEELERDSRRFVFTTISGDDIKRVDNVSYHFNHSCMAALPVGHHAEAQDALESEL
ncbi:hypothetical protein EMPS_03911 [Entomortierella parvispora]|uniref:Uncharacterized protein n=1 Tax=Entomortierella parvispora TaxID=205924 RepID=A0A9P3LUV9_9FUNG|nr:hypothetical protein EMPS_03911 [Entomortierella parvispora]